MADSANALGGSPWTCGKCHRVQYGVPGFCSECGKDDSEELLGWKGYERTEGAVPRRAMEGLASSAASPFAATEAKPDDGPSPWAMPEKAAEPFDFGGLGNPAAEKPFDFGALNEPTKDW